ncbi:hypothetical protein [Segetibacter aerophilus]|uniref:Uncharacterized protein n=1 Tax=Segetibacter aerophilus TaxID=670293 RepID=A0A512B9X4_9BACT|nr:hypothetical protein [Segetibacter aerophilus]GEO08761.1 hypothetical protein SAE01_12570 [Segetibacter aerophilus]
MKLISYHSNLYLDTFKEHVEEIKAKGFDTVLFCITETDLFFNLGTFKELREYAEGEGLKTWATFWGLTAGEAICRECDIAKWVHAVKETGFGNVMIDEPKNMQSISAFLDFSHLLDFHLCLCDKTFSALSDYELTSLPVRSLGVSCYHWTDNWYKIRKRTAATAERLHWLRPEDNFIFIQGFDIPEGMEKLPEVVKETCEQYLITNFAFWSFKCTAATSSKRPVNHRQIWESIQF